MHVTRNLKASERFLHSHQTSAYMARTLVFTLLSVLFALAVAQFNGKGNPGPASNIDFHAPADVHSPEIARQPASVDPRRFNDPDGHVYDSLGNSSWAGNGGDEAHGAYDRIVAHNETDFDDAWKHVVGNLPDFNLTSTARKLEETTANVFPLTNSSSLTTFFPPMKLKR